MKALNIFIAGIVFISSCGNSTKGTSVSANSDSTIKWNKLLSGNQCNMENPLNVVIYSQQQFDSIWAKAFSMDMPPEKPNIDFTKNSAIALFLGTVSNGGHSIEISGITQSTGKGILIEAEHTFPGKNCMSTMAIEFPWFIALTDVALPGEKKEFNVYNKSVACE